MAIAYITKVSGSSGAYTNSFATTGQAVSIGDQIELNVTSGNADTYGSVVDNLGNTFVLDKNTLNPTTGERQSNLWRSSVTVAGTSSITVTYTGGQFPDSSYIAFYHSGLATSSPLDVTSSANDSTSFVQSHSTGTTGTTAQADELIIAFGGTSGSASPVFAAKAGYSQGTEQKGFDAFTYGFMAYKIVSATGTQNGDFTSTGFVRGQGGMATYKQAAAAAASSSKLALLGVG